MCPVARPPRLTNGSWTCGLSTKIRTIQVENAELRPCTTVRIGHPLDETAMQLAVPSVAPNIVGLRERMRAGGTVRIYAIGASVTSMFGNCPDANTCGVNSGKANFLKQLVQSLQREYPQAQINATTRAGGGMPIGAVVSCAQTYFSPPPDLVLLDFAIYAGLRPDQRVLSQLGTLLAYLRHHSIVAIVLNFGNWCRDASGRVGPSVYGHSTCQRAILRGEVTQNVRGATATRDAWHAKLGAVARAYNQTSISTMDALVNLVKRLKLRVEDLTHDGMHPLYWPWPNPGAFVYTTYIEAMLRTALVGRHGTYAPPVVAAENTPQQLSNFSIGLRCYGAKGEWKNAVRGASGFRYTHNDFVYVGGEWRRDRSRRERPGYTSLVPNDWMTLKIDARRARTLQVQYFGSYEHTGIFDVRCLRGCVCAASVDTLTPDVRYATTREAYINLRDGKAACHVSIINRSSRGDNINTKIKISAVSVIS